VASRSSRIRGAAGAVAALLAGVLAVACSSGPASTTSSSGSFANPGVTPLPPVQWPSSPGPALPASYPTIAGYAAAVTAAEKPLTWAGPTTSTKVPKKGYLVAIGCTPALIGCHLGADAAVAAVKQLGWRGKVVSVENPADTDQAMQTAILDGATAILLQGIDESLVPIGLREAHAKHIPVVSTFQENTPGPEAVNYEVNPNARAEGQLLADAMIANNNGKVDVLFLDDNEYGLPVLVLKDAMAQLKACTICHITFAPPINFTGNTVNTTFPGRVVGALRADKSINSMLVGYDPPATYLVPAINAAGLRNQAQLYSQLGDTLHYVQARDAFANDIGASLAWAAWGALDEIFRYLNNQPFVVENVPAQMFNYANVPPGNTPFSGVSSGFEQKYLGLWGRSTTS
jgi:ribose transport system substrate-binding protein